MGEVITGWRRIEMILSIPKSIGRLSRCFTLKIRGSWPVGKGVSAAKESDVYETKAAGGVLTAKCACKPDCLSPSCSECGT